MAKRAASSAVSILIAVCLLLCMFAALVSPSRSLTRVRAPNGFAYLVRDVPDKAASAAQIARMNARTEILLNRLQMDANGPWALRASIQRLLGRYRQGALTQQTLCENPRTWSRDTSFVQDKGKRMVLCLRSRDGRDALYEDNKMFLVWLHELAHIASVGEGHHPEFDAIFAHLRKKAVEYGLWRPIDETWEYCGLTVSPHRP
jgi:hypothetical protein